MFGIPCAEKGEENWISVGVTGGHWKNSVKRICEHASTQYHVSNMVSLKTYLQAKPIDGQSTGSAKSRRTIETTERNITQSSSSCSFIGYNQATS